MSVRAAVRGVVPSTALNTARRSFGNRCDSGSLRLVRRMARVYLMVIMRSEHLLGSLAAPWRSAFAVTKSFSAARAFSAAPGAGEPGFFRGAGGGGGGAPRSTRKTPNNNTFAPGAERWRRSLTHARR